MNHRYIQQGGISQGVNKSGGEQARGANQPGTGVNKPGGESARGRKPRVNKPGGEPAKGQKSHNSGTPCHAPSGA